MKKTKIKLSISLVVVAFLYSGCTQTNIKQPELVQKPLVLGNYQTKLSESEPAVKKAVNLEKINNTNSTLSFSARINSSNKITGINIQNDDEPVNISSIGFKYPKAKNTNGCIVGWARLIDKKDCNSDGRFNKIKNGGGNNGIMNVIGTVYTLGGAMGFYNIEFDYSEFINAIAESNLILYRDMLSELDNKFQYVKTQNNEYLKSLVSCEQKDLKSYSNSNSSDINFKNCMNQKEFTDILPSKRVYKDDIYQQLLAVDKELSFSEYIIKLRENAKGNTSFEKINSLTQYLIDDYLKPRKPIDIQSKMPEEVKKPLMPKEILLPQLPALPVLVKDEFETKSMFDKRVEEAITTRQLAISEIQKQYRLNVEKRNLTIENLSKDYKIAVSKRNEKIEKLQNEYNQDLKLIETELQTKRLEVQANTNQFIKLAFFAVMGEPYLINPRYDAETTTMYAELKTTGSDFSKLFSFQVGLNEAKSFKENIDKIKPSISFEITNGSIVLKDAKANNSQKDFVAILTEKDYQPEKVQVVLQDAKVDFKANAISKLDLQIDTLDLKLQNPNLTDKYQVQALGYGDSNKAKGIKYNNDLIPMIKNLKAEKVDSKKWLFVVAVENYDEADAVTYAKNSAEDFVKVAQKRLGISERNTYSLIDDKATSGSIKDRLDMMLQNVKDGDSVYFYYSGHGIPNPNDGEAYILPKDKIVDYVVREKEFMVRNIYKQLSDSRASKVVAFMDSCFSGNTDGISNIKGVAATRVKTKKVEFDKDKMVVLTAGTANQFSNMYKEKGHRLFSYFLTKAMIERPNLDVDSIYKSIAVDVKDESFKMGDLKVQEPQMEGNNKIEL
jgi:hypothetical protein